VIPRILKSLSKSERQLLVGVSIIFVTAVLFWGTLIFYKGTSEKPASGGTYTEGVIDQPIAVNPLISTNEADRDIAQLVFADLLTLSEKYEANADKKIWTFDLKPDLKWSDGKPLTANDVIFTLEVILDTDTRSPLYQTWQGVVGERVSERQFRFLLKTPYAFFEDNLRNFKVMPRHLFENIPTANIALSSYNLEPVGSGPYKFVGYNKRKDGFITDYRLTRNPHYAGDKPFIDDFNFKFFSNKEDLLAAFNNKEIDGVGGLGLNDIAKIKITNTVYKITIPAYYSISFNPSLNEALKEKEVRQALTLAIDKSGLVKTVFDSQAMVIHGPIVPALTGYDPAIYEQERFSPEEAKKLLDDRGWVLGADGMRSKSVGSKKVVLQFELTVPQVEFLTATADFLKTGWEAIGVKVTTNVMRPSEVISNAIKTRNYQLILFGTILKTNPDIFSFWHSSERFYPGGNLATFNNKTVDGLLESVKSDFNATTSAQSLSKIQQIINDERPAIFLYSPSYFYVANRKLNGFDQKIIATRADRFDNVAKWHLKTTRSLK